MPIGAVSLGLVLWGLAPASAGPESSTAATQAGFSNGVAKATAVVSKVAPGVGALELGISNGVAVAELKNKLGQAQAQSIDLGLIGTTLTAETCRDAAFTPDDLPQPTRVDNRNGDADATSDELPLAGSTLGAGRETARATSRPSAEAIATSVAGVTPVVSLGGGRAQATVEVIDGAARQAHATVDADALIAGVVDLKGMRWDAVHRTGSDPRAEGSFDIGTASVLGVPLPLDSLVDVQTALNQALAPSGITLVLPRVERLTQPTDLVRVTPLRILLKDSPAGKTALGPGINLTRQQREELFDQLTAQICDAAGALLVGDIALSVASGTGFLVVEVGGAEAISGDFDLENPFGGAIAPPGEGPLAGLYPDAPAAAGLAPGPVTGGTATVAPASSIGPIRSFCETIHPFGSPGCSRGALVPLGLLGLATALGVGALDWRHQRRRLAAVSAQGAPA